MYWPLLAIAPSCREHAAPHPETIFFHRLSPDSARGEANAVYGRARMRLNLFSAHKDYF